MFGYVFPYKMELKIKDFEKFKAYYCGLCLSIKENYGNLPRLTLNYDMTFLAILLDALEDKEIEYKSHKCFIHPFKKKIVVINSDALNYAAFCNVCLSYYKLLDDVYDENSIKSRLSSKVLHKLFYKFPDKYNLINTKIKDNLDKLYLSESNSSEKSLDELSHNFAHITGIILSSYLEGFNENLYTLGYNLGKWIYIIDAYDDLKKDMENHRFNAINSCYNVNHSPFEVFKKSIDKRIDFILTNCGRQCADQLTKIPLKKNKELLYNILNLGLIEKMDKVKNKE
ncbi:DUF5685 family protein [Clostridium sp. JN-9]|uniref:DUF5685 family protein n=1 Tax=Clostridium sp. JN-9 TaxID=2507159 RepID=UPI000FFE0654|nr:DUF5685 family protein [Clostridium sp. JN-9]QAT39019.1 hypothetical protein EQM05_01395 [Clostridium sp. JN-9]